MMKVFILTTSLERAGVPAPSPADLETAVYLHLPRAQAEAEARLARLRAANPALLTAPFYKWGGNAGLWVLNADDLLISEVVERDVIS